MIHSDRQKQLLVPNGLIEAPGEEMCNNCAVNKQLCLFSYVTQTTSVNGKCTLLKHKMKTYISIKESFLYGLFIEALAFSCSFWTFCCYSVNVYLTEMKPF